MTGTPKVKPPKNDPEWSRNVEKRLNSTEHPVSTRIGPWCLSADPDTGNLLASYVNGGTVILATPPEGGIDPDAVTPSGMSSIRVTRVANQTLPANTITKITWDTVARATDDWPFTAPGGDLSVPVAGIYLATINVYFADTNAAATSCVGGIQVNGSAPMLVESFYTDATGVSQGFGCVDTIRLGAGDTVNGFALSTGSYPVGTSPRGANAVTSMSLTRLPIDI